MDEERNRREVEGIDTADQPAEGGPMIEDRTSQQRAEEQRRGTPMSESGNRREMDRSQDENMSLFERDATEKFRARWLAIQSKFVDDPSDSVKQADELVVDVIQSVTQSFADRRGNLERHWKGGEEASTEDLRIALKQYRSFFDRLLNLES